MRSAGHQRVVPRHATPTTPPASSPEIGILFDLRQDEVFSTGDDAVVASTKKTPRKDEEAGRMLEFAIRQRIKMRLAGRVRNLVVRVIGDFVILEGQCSTYYTKQLAQHTALGILEDEHLENAIVVAVM